VNLVVDASVLIKFYVPEILSDRAEQLLSQVEQDHTMLLVPDLIYSEVGNILWKKHRLRELTRSEIVEITDAIVSLPITVESTKLLLRLAVDISMTYGITVYDAIYVSTAMVHETKIVTADRKLVEAMTKTDLKDYVVWLGSGEWGKR
jgi:predicted nucleic acid-binding protein